MRGRIYIDIAGKDQKRAKQLLLDGIEASRLQVRGQRRALQKPVFPASQTTSPPAGETNTRQGKLKILFLASEAGTGLDLRRQFREIRVAVTSARYGKNIQIKGVFDATSESILKSINSVSPNVIHFSGKQSMGDILINSNSGGAKTISDRQLAGLLRSVEHIELAIIDTCYSLRCAKSISEVVDCAIGVKSFIYEEDTTCFYAAFYRALASGRSIADAHAQAKAALEFENVPDSQIPKLRCRKGVNPAAKHLAKITP